MLKYKLITQEKLIVLQSVFKRLQKNEKLLWHVDNTTQTLPLHHEIKSFVNILKRQIMSDEFVNLDFLHLENVKISMLSTDRIYMRNDQSSIWLVKLQQNTMHITFKFLRRGIKIKPFLWEK